jgi:5-methylcytosine-specific restriction endonuclease McrBC regulatory subunit McrC
MIQQFRIWDNCQGQDFAEWHDESNAHHLFSDGNRQDLCLIANTPVGELVKVHPELLVFPPDFKKNGDEIDKLHILGLSIDKATTGNLMGFVGVNNTQVNICSRFSKNDKNDYFLHYMLCKVFRINLFNLQYGLTKDPVFDFLLYLFPHYLKKAMRQGLFKQYHNKRFNDANVRGVINVSRHIKENIPFKGTICYDTREHSYDNNITQLIRHTIEFIKQKPLGKAILQNDADTKTCVSQILLATPTYNQSSRQRVIKSNIRPLKHPYFVDYTPLQRLCLQILRHESIKYGNEKDKVYGILFDGAWLWEEYLNTVLHGLGFHHPENKLHTGGFKMFRRQNEDEQISKNSRVLFPDFYQDDFILDAKYKHLNRGIGREDLYQVVTYMYCKKANHGGYVYPDEGTNSYSKYQLEGYNGYIHLVPVLIPQDKSNYSAFIQTMEESEKRLRSLIQDAK